MTLHPRGSGSAAPCAIHLHCSPMQLLPEGIPPPWLPRTGPMRYARPAGLFKMRNWHCAYQCLSLTGPIADRLFSVTHRTFSMPERFEVATKASSLKPLGVDNTHAVE